MSFRYHLSTHFGPANQNFKKVITESRLVRSKTPTYQISTNKLDFWPVKIVWDFFRAISLAPFQIN